MNKAFTHTQNQYNHAFIMEVVASHILQMGQK